LTINTSQSSYRYVFLWVRNSDSLWLIRMLVLMMTASNVDEYPSILLEYGDNFAAVHVLIIHTVHMKSTFMTTSQ